MLKALFLTPWYPSDKDSMAGLFVQKHVEAVRAQGVDVRVIHAQTLYDTWSQWRALRREGWRPDVVQLNVIQKQGLLALWLKRRYGIPYVIIEHWTGYLPENGTVKPTGLHTRFMQRVCRKAEVVMPVSEHLGKAMQTLGFRAKRWEKVNNVVDDFFYESTVVRTPAVPKRLLHISCVDEAHKNIKGILRAVKTLSATHPDLTLTIVGISVDHQKVRAYADALNFPEGMVRWAGEITPREVAKAFDEADIFVLNSNYENAPVVIAESVVKGVPVVSTNVGGIPEMVDAQSGILIAPNDDKQLVEALTRMLDRYGDYKRKEIQKNGAQYSFAAVGAQLKAIYCNCVPAK